jgi:hypothetical protein
MGAASHALPREPQYRPAVDRPAAEGRTNGEPIDAQDDPLSQERTGKERVLRVLESGLEGIEPPGPREVSERLLSPSVRGVEKRELQVCIPLVRVSLEYALECNSGPLRLAGALGEGARDDVGPLAEGVEAACPLKPREGAVRRFGPCLDGALDLESRQPG